ncbi:MAG: hypothetical protein WCA07_07125 [Gloeobacterales cyanobacterium]
MRLKSSRIVATVTCISLITGAGVFSQMAGAQPETPFSPQIPKGCTALQEVSTGSTVVRKQFRLGNENADFAVPVGRVYKSYRAELRPENNADYSVKVNLKYSDNSSSTVYDGKISMTRMKPYALTFRSPIVKQPYQINIVVGSARNNAYSIAAQACSK